MVLVHYNKWCWYTTINGIGTLQKAVLVHYNKWCWYTTINGIGTLQ